MHAILILRMRQIVAASGNARLALDEELQRRWQISAASRPTSPPAVPLPVLLDKLRQV